LLLVFSLCSGSCNFRFGRRDSSDGRGLWKDGIKVLAQAAPEPDKTRRDATRPGCYVILSHTHIRRLVNMNCTSTPCRTRTTQFKLVDLYCCDQANFPPGSWHIFNQTRLSHSRTAAGRLIFWRVAKKYRTVPLQDEPDMPFVAFGRISHNVSGPLCKLVAQQGIVPNDSRGP
jgi:hypothetical protein